MFERVGVDYAGPFYIKYGFVHKPTIVRPFISTSVGFEGYNTNQTILSFRWT